MKQATATTATNKTTASTTKAVTKPATSKQPIPISPPSTAAPTLTRELAAKYQLPVYETFPMVHQFRKADATKAKELMQDYVGYLEQEEAIRETKKSIQAELAAIADRYNAPGMRFESLVTYCTMKAGKKTLSKTLLLENGVTPAQLDASYAVGAEKLEVKVVDLAKPKKGRGRPEEDE